MKIVIEPSSAVALAPLLRPGGMAALGLARRTDGGVAKIGVILSGGNVELGG
jgi:threonine dehydratase